MHSGIKLLISLSLGFLSINGSNDGIDPTVVISIYVFIKISRICYVLVVEATAVSKPDWAVYFQILHSSGKMYNKQTKKIQPPTPPREKKTLQEVMISTIMDNKTGKGIMRAMGAMSF